MIVFALSLHRLPYLQVCHNTSLVSFSPNRAYPDGDAMSGMRYADTNFLIVTCYLLPQGLETLLCLRPAFALASLCLRFRFAPIDGASTDLQRIYNGGRTELHRRGSRAFFASLHRFLCGVNEFSMMSTKSGLCNPFQENDNLSSIMSTNAV